MSGEEVKEKYTYRILASMVEQSRVSEFEIPGLPATKLSSFFVHKPIHCQRRAVPESGHSEATKYERCLNASALRNSWTKKRKDRQGVVATKDKYCQIVMKLSERVWMRGCTCVCAVSHLEPEGKSLMLPYGKNNA